jgi:agmatinase
MRILNATSPYNLFGLEGQDYDSARIVAVPVPYDSTTSYQAGTRNGPGAIIEASRNLELYSEELGKDISKAGIFTTEELAPDYSSPENMVGRIEKETAIICNDSKIPLLLGGEHTISLGAIRALAKKEKEFSVLHFDAHSDSRDEFMGTRYSHVCVMARVREVCKSCYSVGVRSTDEASARKYKDIMYMKDMHAKSCKQISDMIVRSTKKRIYLSIDLDVLDPSEMPSVGTPEPDGMRFRELKEILKSVLEDKQLLGMDLVELAPIPGFTAPNYLAAKLAYVIVGYATARSSAH